LLAGPWIPATGLLQLASLAHLDAPSAAAGISLLPESRGPPQIGLRSEIHHAYDLLR